MSDSRFGTGKSLELSPDRETRTRTKNMADGEVDVGGNWSP